MAVDGGTLAAIKAAIDGGRLLLDVGRAWDQAEIRLKVVELLSALTDAKRVIADLNDSLRDRDRELADLKRAAADRASLVYEAPFYWRQAQETRDGPFCQRCNDVDGKSVRLIDVGRALWTCGGCKLTYPGPDRAKHVEAAQQQHAQQRGRWMG